MLSALSALGRWRPSSLSRPSVSLALPGTPPPFFLFWVRCPCISSLFLYRFTSPSSLMHPFTFLRSLLPPLLHKPSLGRITSLFHRCLNKIVSSTSNLSFAVRCFSLSISSFTLFPLCRYPLRPTHPASLTGWFISRYRIFPISADINVAQRR